MTSVFEEAVDAVVSQWTKATGGGYLTVAEKNEVLSILRTAGFESFAAGNIATFPAKLAGPFRKGIPVFWTGDGAQLKADKFIEEMASIGQSAFTIGDTKWGKFVEGPIAAGAINRVASILEPFANRVGGLQYNGSNLNLKRGLSTVLSNVGSADFADRAIASGIPARLIVGTNPSADSGFGRMESGRLAAAGYNVNGEPARVVTSALDYVAYKEGDIAFAAVQEAHYNSKGVQGLARYWEGNTGKFWEFLNGKKGGKKGDVTLYFL
jgi:hypothetical protein